VSSEDVAQAFVPAGSGDFRVASFFAGENVFESRSFNTGSCLVSCLCNLVPKHIASQSFLACTSEPR
jgi:hypothetical protein